MEAAQNQGNNVIQLSDREEALNRAQRAIRRHVTRNTQGCRTAEEARVGYLYALHECLNEYKELRASCAFLQAEAYGVAIEKQFNLRVEQ